MSPSSPVIPPKLSVVSHTAIQLPAASEVSWMFKSFPESMSALTFNAAGGVQVDPLSAERDNKMSPSSPMDPPRLSKDCQTAIQLPAESVVSWGSQSSPESVAALVFSAAGSVQVWPASVEREKRISSSVPSGPPAVRGLPHGDPVASRVGGELRNCID